MELQKYKKYHKKKNIFKKEKSYLAYVKKGIFGFKLLEFGFITPKQVETMRRIIARVTKRFSKIIINVSSNFMLTKKPLLSRMGKGCGSASSSIIYIKKGKIVVEIQDVQKKIAFLAFQVVQRRLRFKMDFVEREIVDA